MKVVLSHSKSDTSQRTGLERIKHKNIFPARKHWNNMFVCSTTSPNSRITTSLHCKCSNFVIFGNAQEYPRQVTETEGL